MAGHSHSANIAHRKGRADKKRGNLFGKLSRAILASARRGGGDPDMNLALRYAIDKARKNSMPKENIDRAIKRGLGETDGVEFEELIYEGYGPGGVAVICEALTENRNRTAPEMRKIFEVHGGNLGSTGCVSWMFEKKGLFTVSKSQATEDQLFELALEAGADDVRDAGEICEVTCPVEAFQRVADALAAAKIETSVAEFSWVPSSVVELNADHGRAVLKLLEALEENDDIQNVTANYSIPDDILQQVLADS
jgi:YebC/PmpR family DNA-binding regulatory protein